MAFPQLRLDFGPMSPERIEHFETIRKTRVPRFLFRAFTAASGGGQHLAINNESEIVPHGLMDGSELDFYSRSEAEILQLVFTHMSSREYPLTLCTSWAATLFGVLRYAKYLAQDHDAWIAVIDTHLLEDVLVFNDHDLVGMGGLEFQAYGRISGAGYKAVKLSAMVNADLYQLFPELESWVPPSSARLSPESFGQDFHREVFVSPVVRVTIDDVQVAKRITVSVRAMRTFSQCAPHQISATFETYNNSTQPCLFYKPLQR